MGYGAGARVAKSAYVVFVLPVAVTVPAAALVMAGLLDGGAEGSAALVAFSGLPEEHPASEPLVVSAVADPAFDCGDVYITVFGQDGEPVVQESYFGQCFAVQNLEIPVGEEFSVMLDEGTYRVSISVLDAAKSGSASADAVVAVG